MMRLQLLGDPELMRQLQQVGFPSASGPMPRLTFDIA
jgi:hypothetical protein